MKLNLTEEEKNNVRITYNNDQFEVFFGKEKTKSKEYKTVDEMMDEFQENKIATASFDEQAHHMFNLAFGKA